VNSHPAAAGDGPRLLDQQTLRRPAATPANSANIRIDVDMAVVPVTVMDTTGHNVLGLDRSNFRVFDGAEQRPIVSFGTSDAPLSLGIIFDSSRSMRDKFGVAREAPAALFRQLNAEDEAFLITLADHPQLRQPFTATFSDIQNALLFTHPDGTTSLLDAVNLGLEEMKKAHNPRKALVIVSDGGDNNSRYTLRELAGRASESDVQIFSICIFQNPKTVEEADGPDLLAKLAQSSGGIRYMINDVSEMRKAFGFIGVTLHNQYVLGYYPPETGQDGKYHKIKVQLLTPPGLPRLMVFARSGYYAPEK
jgi:Ca-activated chloride channel family protein